MRIYDGSAAEALYYEALVYAAIIGAARLHDTLCNQNEVLCNRILLANEMAFFEGGAREVENKRILSDDGELSEVGYLVHFLFDEDLDWVVVEACAFSKLNRKVLELIVKLKKLGARKGRQRAIVLADDRGGAAAAVNQRNFAEVVTFEERADGSHRVVLLAVSTHL